MALGDEAEAITLKEVNALSTALEDPQATLSSMIVAFVTEAEKVDEPSEAQLAALQQRVAVIDMVTKCYKDDKFC